MQIVNLDKQRPLRHRKALVERFEDSAWDANPALFLAVALEMRKQWQPFHFTTASRPFAGRVMQKFIPDWAMPVADERALTDGDFSQGSGFSAIIKDWSRECGVDVHLYRVEWHSPRLVHRQRTRASRYYLSFPTENDAFAWKMRWQGTLPTESDAFAWMGAKAA